MVSKEEKTLRLLAYLKKYTDKDNPASMPLIDYYFERKGAPDFFGPPASRRKTRRALIKELVRACNSDINGNLLPREEWLLTYDGFGEEEDPKHGYICNLYYIQPFSKNEVKDIIKCINTNPEFTDDYKKTLTEKVIKHISNENYQANECFLQRGANPVDKKKYLKEKNRSTTFRPRWRDDDDSDWY